MGTFLIPLLSDHAHAPTGPGCEKTARDSHIPSLIVQNLGHEGPEETKQNGGLCRWVWFPFNDEKNACLFWADDKLIQKTLHKCSLLSCRVKVNNIKENIPLFSWKPLMFKALHNGAGMGYSVKWPSSFTQLSTVLWQKRRMRERDFAHVVVVCFCTCGFLGFCFFNDNSLRISW